MDEVDKAMFQVAEVIFWFLTNPKCDLFEVDKAMFHMVEWHFELIFWLLTSPKFFLD